MKTVLDREDVARLLQRNFCLLRFAFGCIGCNVCSGNAGTVLGTEDIAGLPD